MPAYTAAACIIVFGLIFPLYRVYGIVLVAVIAAAAYFFSKKYFFKDKIIQEESEPVFRTGIAELDESLEQANVLIEQLRRANISIKSPAVSAHIDRMTRSGDAILAELNAHPEKARKLRRFLTYYLPTSVKFMQTYAEHEASPTGGENSAEIMRGIENGYAIGHDLALLDYFRSLGVVYMTLCHNGDNDICDSARGNAEHGGLSAFGREVVGRMNALGMMVDMSHAAESSFYDALELSTAPIVCSHSSSRALCNHPRNLTDDQMKALAAKGGVAQVTLYHGFLRQEGEATILDALEHLHHMVSVMGPEHVGIGTDFDGDGGARGLKDASELIGFTRELLRQRYSEQDLQGIWGGNFLRVMRQVQASATL